MSLAFENALEVLFADPNIGLEAIYTSNGGAPVLVCAVARRADAVSEFGDMRLWSETTRIDLRVAEVPNPRPGDRIKIDGDAFLIQGAPVRDRERLVWTVDLTGSIAQIRLRPDCPYSRTDLSYDLCDRDAERGLAVQHGNANLELRDLSDARPRFRAWRSPKGAPHILCEVCAAAP